MVYVGLASLMCGGAWIHLGLGLMMWGLICSGFSIARIYVDEKKSSTSASSEALKEIVKQSQEMREARLRERETQNDV